MDDNLLEVKPLSGGDLNLAIGDLLLQILGVFPVDGAPDADAGTEDLLDSPGHVLSHGPVPHGPGDLDDVIEADVAIVLDVLHLLPVPLGLLESLDDERRGGGDDGDLRLSVLDGELDGDAEALPVLGRLFGDVLTDLLGGETERADLGGQGRRRADLASGHPDVDVHHLRRVELGRHGCCSVAGDGGGGRVWEWLRRRIRGKTGGLLLPTIDRRCASPPSVIVIGGGISGVAAARALSNASFEVTVLESRDRIGGRVHTDYSFGCPIDMGASWLHGACNENSLAPLIGYLGLRLYRTSGDNSVLYDHDLESYALFDKEGHQVPKETVAKVGETFERILEETVKVRDEQENDMPLLQAISIVLERHPDLKLEGLDDQVLQWCVCRLEAWFAADADEISLKNWDQERVLTGGHGLMVNGYCPVIQALAQGLDIRLNQRVTKIARQFNGVTVTVEDGTNYTADACIITVPLGVLKANIIKFEPELPPWKTSAIEDLGVGVENKVAMRFDKVFWPNVEVLGMVGPTPKACGYFLNLHKATGNPVLVYMAAGRFAQSVEKLSDKEAVDLVMSFLKKMLPDATEPTRYLVSRWGSDPNALGSYSCDLVGKPADVCARFSAPVESLYFAGEAASADHSGSVHGAYSSGLAAAEDCRKRLLMQKGIPDLVQVAAYEEMAVVTPLQICRT